MISRSTHLLQKALKKNLLLIKLIYKKKIDFFLNSLCLKKLKVFEPSLLPKRCILPIKWRFGRGLILPTLLLLCSSYTVVEDQSKLKILTPTLATRKTKKLRLDNGLEAYLISDPGTHQSGAALAVEVGSFDDIESRPGIAHFIEHMLFMGTEKYPQEEEYHSFLNGHGGKCNAYTADDRTVYSFSCDNDSFAEGLDRFSSLFISPLFRSSSLQREALAIDQEFCKDLPLDPWRIIFVKKELANPEHPFHRFCIGNKQTLADTTSEELKDWFEKHYSSHIMHLAVYSKESLEILEKEVVEMFSQVKRRDILPSSCNPETSFFAPSQSMIAIAPLQELKMLEISFELPAHFLNDKDSHAEDIVAYVLGHEGENSLFAQLKKENLAEGLSAEKEVVGKKRFFSITIKLTNKGVQEYEKVISTCYNAILNLGKSGIPKYIFDEIQEMKKTRFAYQSREEPFNFVTEVAAALIDESLETFPDKTMMPSNYVPERIHEVLAQLTPEQGLITYVIDPKIIKAKANLTEKWMGTPYTLLPISEKNYMEWKQASLLETIGLPLPNPFMPKNLEIVSIKAETETSLPNPQILCQSEKATIYFQMDNRYLTPEISWVFSIKTPMIKAYQPNSIAMADIYCHALNKRLNEKAYEASLGGLKHKLCPTENGIKLQIEGYSEKAFAFLQVIIEEMQAFSPTQEEFASGIEYFASDYKNRLNKTPISQGAEILWSVVYKDYPSLGKKDRALTDLTYIDFVTFSQSLYSRGYIEGLMYGNMTNDEGVLVSDYLNKQLIQDVYPINTLFKKSLASFPNDKHPVYLTKKSKIPSNALILVIDCGEYSYEKKAALNILAKGLHEPFFSELRSKQQTGYLVQSWADDLENHLYTFFMSQSSTHDTRDLMARFELFLETSLRNLSDDVISKSRFEALRTSLIVGLEHPAENIKTMAPLLHKLAFEHKGDFAHLNKEIEALKTLSYEQFQTYAEEFLGKENSRRLAVCINGNISTKKTCSYKHVTSIEKLRQTITYEEKK